MTKQPSLVTLLLLMPFASIAAVLFTPALPEIAALFQMSASSAGSAMTLFLAGYALGNLPYGPIAKRWGRKPAIYCGTLLTMLGCIIILLAGHTLCWPLLLVGRFVSALGSSVGMKIAFTIIADTFQGAKGTKAVSIATTAFAVAPGLSVAIGGFLTTAYGWQSCFYAVLLYSLVLLILSTFLPETAPYLEHGPLHIRETYKRKFKNKGLVYSSLTVGCATSIVYLFSTLAPFLAIRQLGSSPELYGLMNFIPPLGLLAGSWTSHWLSTRKTPLFSLRVGTYMAIGSALGMLLLFSISPLSVWTLFLPMPLLYFGTSLIFNNGSIVALQQSQDKSNGSAVMGFLNMTVAMLSVLVAEWIASPNPLFLPLSFLILALLAFLFLSRLKTYS